jgi:translocation and assembly module TamB
VSRRLRLPLTLGVLPALLLTLAVAGGFVLCTQSGLQAAVALVNRYGGEQLSIGSAQGRLLGESLLSNVHYQGSDGLQVEIRRLHLRVRGSELLLRRLHVVSAEVAGVRVGLPPPDNTPSAPLRKLPQSLPLNVVIDAFTLKDFQLDREHENILKMPQAQLAASWIGRQLQIVRLAAELPQTGALQASGQAQMSADHVDVQRLTIKGPGELSLQGRFGIDKAASDLQLQWHDLRWPLVATRVPPTLGGFSGSLHVTGPLDDFHYELHGSATLHKKPVKVNADGTGNPDGLRIASLGLDTDPGSLYAQGRVDWAPVLRADLTVRFTQFDPGLFSAGWNGALYGIVSTETRLHDGRPEIGFMLNLAPSTLRGQPLTLAAAGSTDLRGVTLQSFKLQSGKGRVEGKGRVAWAPSLRADAQLQIAHFNPAQFLPQWRGDLNGTIAATTVTRAGHDVVSFDARFAGSQLRGRPLTLDAQGELADGNFDLHRFALAAGATTLSASGRATPPFDLGGRFDSPDLTALLPELYGHAQLAFKLQGPLATPHLVTQGSAAAVRYHGERLGTLHWDADLDPQQPSHLTLQLADARLAGQAVSRARLAVTGLETYQHIRFDADTERGDLSLSADGGYDRKKMEWGGNVAALSLTPAGLPAWTLEKPIGLLLGQKRQSVEPACLSGDGGRVCLRLEQNVVRQGLRLSWTLDRLALDTFKPVLPPDLDLSGSADGNGSIEIAQGDIAAASVVLNLGRSRIAVPQAPPLEILPSSFRLDDQSGRLHATLDLQTSRGSVRADASAAPAADYAARALSGSAQIHVPDLDFVATLLPALQDTGGSIEGQLDFGGSIGLPRIGGQLALSDGHARLAVAGITLEHLQLRANGSGAGPLALTGSMTSGGGTLTLHGSVDPSSSPLHADLTLSGENVQVMATPDARIWASPDLHLLSDAGTIHLDGTLAVPRAEITPHELDDNGVAVSKDQVIVGAQPVEPSSSLKIYSQLKLTLGDHVEVKSFGLTTRLTGAVTLTDEPQRETRAQGELQLVDGHYKAYGQDLNIQNGRLIFTGGPVTQPAVDLYATRHPQQDITVGVRVRGTLDKPQLTLQSDPAMPREQQLSWLVLGRSLDQSSSGDRSAMSQAALTLGLSGGDYLAQKLGAGVGLDQVSIGQAPVTSSSVAADATAISGSRAAQNVGANAYTTQAAQLTLGKYLTPKLFVSYGVSLFQPGQTFRMLYDIGHGFQLQTESGTASGGDLLYTYEH